MSISCNVLSLVTVGWNLQQLDGIHVSRPQFLSHATSSDTRIPSDNHSVFLVGPGHVFHSCCSGLDRWYRVTTSVFFVLYIRSTVYLFLTDWNGCNGRIDAPHYHASRSLLLQFGTQRCKDTDCILLVPNWWTKGRREKQCVTLWRPDKESKGRH